MELRGRFFKVLFYNQQNGYTVALFKPFKSQEVKTTTVTGILGEVNSDEIYLLQGDFVDHPKYGYQFKVDSFTIEKDDSESGLVKYFSSALFKGIGKNYAKKIVKTLGTEAVKLIKIDNDILDTVANMTEKRKSIILQGIAKESDEDLTFLLGHHLTMADAIKLRNTYKKDLMNVINDNPYRLIADIDGLGFAKVDKFALSIGIKEDNFYRLCAYCESLLADMCMKTGDSYVDKDQYQNYLSKKLSKYDLDFSQMLNQLVSTNRIAVEKDRIYLMSQYYSERFISKCLCNFPSERLPKADSQQLFDEINTLQQQMNITYQEKQLQAIMAFFENDFLIITGGPGTGKTTIVAAMIRLSQNIYPNYTISLLAPTGRAAKRLSQLTSYEAKTIHSVLLWDKDTGKFAKDEKNPLTSDILIIDEFSMVDQYLFYSLLKAATYCKKIIIIGDSDQLPSVAMGSVLRDLIDSNLFITIRLDKIYRQKEGSDIITLAYDIKNNCVKDIPIDKDIRFFQCESAQIRDLLMQVVEKALKCYETQEDGFMNVQVLAPMHNGPNGIDCLNQQLQQEFNPNDSNKRQLNVGYHIFREKDKVLQLKNQPDDDVYNGDIGIIIEIIFAKEDVDNLDKIVVDFDGRIVEYTPDNFVNITHAYCMSVHKAQGSEYPIVILPMTNQYSIMLQKRLIYTAVTRAYKSLIIIGDKKAFYKGINTIENYSRKTTLKERLIDCYGQKSTT